MGIGQLGVDNKMEVPVVFTLLTPDTNVPESQGNTPFFFSNQSHVTVVFSVINEGITCNDEKCNEQQKVYSTLLAKLFSFEIFENNPISGSAHSFFGAFSMVL